MQGRFWDVKCFPLWETKCISFSICLYSMKALLQKKWMVLRGSQNNDQDRSLFSYPPKLAPSLLHQSIPISHHTRVTCVHLSVWLITLLIGTLSYLLILPRPFSAQYERAQDYISMLSFLLLVVQFHLQWLQKRHTGPYSDLVSFWTMFLVGWDGRITRSG